MLDYEQRRALDAQAPVKLLKVPSGNERRIEYAEGQPPGSRSSCRNCSGARRYAAHCAGARAADLTPAVAGAASIQVTQDLKGFTRSARIPKSGRN